MRGSLELRWLWFWLWLHGLYIILQYMIIDGGFDNADPRTSGFLPFECVMNDSITMRQSYKLQSHFSGLKVSMLLTLSTFP